MADEKKIWRFFENVMNTELENKLNELANDGYQVFRLDRTKEMRVTTYDIVAFNPQLLGAKHAQGMAASMLGLGDLAGIPKAP